MPIYNRYKLSLNWIWISGIIACLGWLLLPAQSLATTGTIADHADVLDTATVQQTTDSFSYTVDIFTTRTFAGSNSDFDGRVKELASSSSADTSTTNACDPVKDIGCELYTQVAVPASNFSFAERINLPDTSVEVGIDVATRHIAIDGGSSVKIENARYDQAITAFANTMHQTHDDYTQATIATLNTLESSSDRFWKGVSNALPYILIGGILIALFIAAAISRTAYQKGYYGSRYGGRNSWGGGGGFGGGGSGSSGGGGGGSSGGGGASGNF